MILEQFGSYVFPRWAPVEDVPGAPSPGALTDLPAGGHGTAWGWEIAGRCDADEELSSGATPAACAAVDLYLENLGKRDQLWRARM
jgi:hypothetical protein